MLRISLISFMLIILLIGCGPLVPSDSSHDWTTKPIAARVPLPPDTIDYCQIGTSHFVVSANKLLRSRDNGKTWTEPSSIDYVSRVNHIDEDLGKLYVACRSGVFVSDDEANNFHSEYRNDYDDVGDIDVVNGYGWMVVRSWGTDSGPHRKTPTETTWKLTRGNIPWEAMDMSRVKTDPRDPGRIADVYGVKGYFVTNDAGVHWAPY